MAEVGTTTGRTREGGGQGEVDAKAVGGGGRAGIKAERENCEKKK